MKPLRLFYWQGDNFGDALSPKLVALFSGRQVAWAPVHRCEMIALGSLMHMITPIHRAAANSDSPPWIWGTGTSRPMPAPVLSLLQSQRVRVAALRGPVTAALTQTSQGSPFGDPGLFADQLLAERPDRSDRIGIVPHWRLAEDPELLALVAGDPRLVIIDPRGSDPLDVVRRIGECRFVLGSSLHGLVIADSLGVPNHWLVPDGNHVFPSLKFVDYAASIGRNMGAPLTLKQVPDFIAGKLPETLSYTSGIAAARQALIESFPAELKAH